MPRMENLLHQLLLLAAGADENKPASPSKDIAKSSSLDSSKLDALVAAVAEGEQAADIEPATAS